MAYSFKALSTTALLKIVLICYTQRMSTSILGDINIIIIILISGISTIHENESHDMQYIEISTEIYNLPIYHHE